MCIDIKALEWEGDELDTIRAVTILGQYAAWEIGGDGYFLAPEFNGGRKAEGGLGGGKAAAQADFNARIRSALVSAPEAGEADGADTPLSLATEALAAIADGKGDPVDIAGQTLASMADLAPAAPTPRAEADDLTEAELAEYEAGLATGGGKHVSVMRRAIAEIRRGRAAIAAIAALASNDAREMAEAAEGVISSRSETFKARNHRDVCIQDENGEKMWIVPFDEMFALETALSRRLPAPDGGAR